MKDKYTILVVDDTVLNVDVLVELLSDTYDVIVALNGQSALETVANYEVDLILLDIMMPIMDGYEVCEMLKSDISTKEIPIIFITAKSDEESIEEAYEVGGIDYVEKPFKPKDLMSRIKTHLQIKQLIFDLEESKERLKILSITDPLTSLYNRRYFSSISEISLNMAKRENKEMSTILIDIDDFKKINDTFGHTIGDDIIVTLAENLKKLTRKVDVVCRWGGEEFLILLSDTALDGALKLAEKIRKSIENIVIPVKDESITFTISLGISKVDKKNKEAISNSILNSDKALYESKSNGKNQVTIIN